MTSQPPPAPLRHPRHRVALVMGATTALYFVLFFVQDAAGLFGTPPAGSGSGSGSGSGAGADATAGASVPWGLVVRYAIAMVVGGALAGAALAGLFGRAGIGGWVLAVVGGLLATMLAGCLGNAVGTLPDMLADGVHLQDLIGIGFGLVLIPLSWVDHPELLAVWLGLILLCHLWTRAARRAGPSD